MKTLRNSIVAGIAGIAFAAQVMAANVVKNIVVNGNQRIETSTITSKINVDEGDSVTQEKLGNMVSDLFRTGYFADVDVDMKGSTLMINVVENPIVSQIFFEGNDELDDDILMENIRLQPRVVYTVAKLKDDTKTISDIYRIKGHFAAKVTPQIIRREQNRVDIVFKIDEKEATKVEKIIFIGNDSFSSGKLNEVIMTKESRWYRFFSSTDTYDPDRMAYDQEKLRQHYMHHGYADFRVKSAVAELTPDHKEFFITFTLHEGERYQYSNVNVVSNIGDIDASLLESFVTMKAGDWFSSSEVDDVVKDINRFMGKNGHPFVKINPIKKLDRVNHTVDLTFEVNQGPRLYVGRISIAGNLRTDSDVIRRQMLLFEGDALNDFLLKQSELRIKALRFFKDVKIKQQAGETPDLVDLVIELDEEESTGEMWIAGGYSTAEGVVGDVGYHEANFLGRGQDLRVKFSLSKKRENFDISFTEPHFLDRNIAAGFDVYNYASKRYFDSSFEHKRTGVDLRFGYYLADYLSQNWRYTIRQDKVTGIRLGASRFIIRESGSAITSMITHTLIYDRRDSVVNPTKGYYVGMTNQVAGLGGDVRYFKNEGFGGYFITFFEDVVLGLTGSTGFVEGFGNDDVRIVDRFNMGGDGSLRGFRESGAEPRDMLSLDPLGGKKFYLATAEAVFPIGLPNEFGIKGSVFAEMGSAWDVEEPAAFIRNDSASPRAAVGVGLSWNSPIGPLRIDFARAIRKRDSDRTKTIHFGMSTRF
ncbi:MAG: outer membrane protein assembly factor BamA [Alphaproteobacteria bacterium]